jgi:hypothetical protein
MIGGKWSEINDIYQQVLQPLETSLAEPRAAYTLIWRSVASLLILLSGDPDRPHNDLLAVIMTKINHTDAYCNDIWWPVRAQCQRDQNPELYERIYTAEDRMAVEEADAFEMKYHFGFRGETLGQWWQKQLTGDKTVLWENWFKVYTESFLPGVFELIGRYGPRLLFRQQVPPDLPAALKNWQAQLTRCWWNRKKTAEKSQPMQQKSFAQYLEERADQ